MVVVGLVDWVGLLAGDVEGYCAGLDVMAISSIVRLNGHSKLLLICFFQDKLILKILHPTDFQPILHLPLHPSSKYY